MELSSRVDLPRLIRLISLNVFRPAESGSDKLITIQWVGPTFIPQRHSLRALKALYVEGPRFIPFAMATPSMRRIFLQAFQSFKKCSRLVLYFFVGRFVSSARDGSARLIRFQYLNTKIMLKM